jgi:hypothetical protein
MAKFCISHLESDWYKLTRLYQNPRGTMAAPISTRWKSFTLGKGNNLIVNGAFIVSALLAGLSSCSLHSYCFSCLIIAPGH